MSSHIAFGDLTAVGSGQRATGAGHCPWHRTGVAASRGLCHSAEIVCMLANHGPSRLMAKWTAVPIPGSSPSETCARSPARTDRDPGRGNGMACGICMTRQASPTDRYTEPLHRRSVRPRLAAQSNWRAAAPVRKRWASVGRRSRPCCTSRATIARNLLFSCNQADRSASCRCLEMVRDVGALDPCSPSGDDP